MILVGLGAVIGFVIAFILFAWWASKIGPNF